MNSALDLNPASVARFGQGGVANETGTNQMVGPFYAVQLLTEASFSEWTEVGATGDAFTGSPLYPQTIFGNIESCTPLTGVVRAYRK